jgi:acetyl-CoA C-acetyltransferase
MASGIKNRVAIIGMGCTQFGELWDRNAEDLIIDAFVECMQDAGIEKKEIQAAWWGCHFDQVNYGKAAVPLSTTLKLPFIPVTRVENWCATGTEALRGACYAVASGAYDMVLALGAEKLKDTGYAGLPGGGNLSQLNAMIRPNYTAPAGFALMATNYMDKYKISPVHLKKALALISVNSHANGFLNPKAHLRRKVTEEDVINAPMVAWPLGLYDCCGVSDGAAAAIVTTPEIARSLKKDFIMVKALQISVTSGEEERYTKWDGSYVMTTTRAAGWAYKEAGIENPREELSLMELHDCFSITELSTYEDLGICARGTAMRDIMEGFFHLDGKLPSQPDGGLKCFGHPIGASGLRMAYEVYNQLLGRCGERQVKNPRLGLTHNLGGLPSGSVCSVAIFGNE